MSRNPWPALGWRALSLGLDAAAVAALRTVKLSAGGAAAASEAQRMVMEKIEASWALQTKAWSGALGATPATIASRTLAHYRPKVRANARRLSRRRKPAVKRS